jgi:hypothetical protein
MRWVMTSLNKLSNEYTEQLNQYEDKSNIRQCDNRLPRSRYTKHPNMIKSFTSSIFCSVRIRSFFISSSFLNRYFYVEDNKSHWLVLLRFRNDNEYQSRKISLSPPPTIEWYRMVSNVGREADRWWVATPTSRKGIVGNISVRHKNVEMILSAHPDSRQAVYKKSIC